MNIFKPNTGKRWLDVTIRALIFLICLVTAPIWIVFLLVAYPLICVFEAPIRYVINGKWEDKWF